jgi:carbonic anhydrase
MNSLTQTRSIVLACALALVPAAAYAEETQHHWGYGGEHGPRHWAEMNAEYEACGVGKAQSPIDIRDAVPAKLDAIEFDYHPTPLHIIDNGHTIQVNYEPGSSISVGGKRYPMVAHLVHKNAEGELAVVAVLLKEGARNPVVKTLWTGLPKEKEKERVMEQVKINAASLLPKNHKYYTFAGSLTTPPCSEGVTWFVLATPKAISKEQVARFGKIYRANARPVQPLNGRAVKVSQ